MKVVLLLLLSLLALSGYAQFQENSGELTLERKGDLNDTLSIVALLRRENSEVIYSEAILLPKALKTTIKIPKDVFHGILYYYTRHKLVADEQIYFTHKQKPLPSALLYKMIYNGSGIKGSASLALEKELELHPKNYYAIAEAFYLHDEAFSEIETNSYLNRLSSEKSDIAAIASYFLLLKLKSYEDAFKILKRIVPKRTEMNNTFVAIEMFSRLLRESDSLSAIYNADFAPLRESFVSQTAHLPYFDVELQHYQTGFIKYDKDFLIKQMQARLARPDYTNYRKSMLKRKLAVVYQEYEDYPGAIEAYKNSLNDPLFFHGVWGDRALLTMNRLIMLYHLTQCLLANKQPQEALIYAAKQMDTALDSLAEAGSYSAALWNMGNVYMAMSLYDLAERTYKDVFQLLRSELNKELIHNLKIYAFEPLYNVKYNKSEGFETYWAGIEAEKSSTKEVKIAAPYFEFKTLQGATYSAQSLKGKVVVLNFWGLSCRPCIEEMPTLNALVAEFAAQPDVVFLAPTKNKEADLNAFLSQKPFNYQVAGLAKSAFDVFDVQGFPTHVVLNKNGDIVYKTLGGLQDTERLKITIQECLR